MNGVVIKELIMSLAMEFDYDTKTALMDEFSQSNIDLLREWALGLDINKCVPKDLTNQQIVLFYHACYGNLEKTKICIEKNYAQRRNSPEMFDNRIVFSDELKSSTETVELAFLPEKSVEGYDIIFHRLHLTEPSKYHLEPSCKLLFMTVDACLYKRGPTPGYIFLFDMKGVRLGHLTRVSLSSLRKFFQYVQEALPLRMKAIHVLNSEPIVDKLLMLIKPFMEKKFFEMIKFHNKNENLDNFYETVIPRSALPPDYGGTLPDTQTLHKKCMQQLQAIEPFFKAEEEQRLAALPDKKRGKALNNSFKKLDID